jgi:hypothetical protein
MRRFVPVAMIGAISLVLAPQAQSAAPTNAQLARQIKVLQKQVKTLQKQVKTARLVATAGLVYSGCSTAVTADALQGTWAVIDQVAGRTIFGPQVPVDDSQLCSVGLEIQRAPNQVPPNVMVFNSLLSLFR